MVSKALKGKVRLTELKNCPNWMFRLVKGFKIDSNEVKEQVMYGCVSMERHGACKDIWRQS